MAKIEFPKGFEEALKALCNSYDVRYGCFVDSDYEGEAIVDYYYQIQGEET